MEGGITFYLKIDYTPCLMKHTGDEYRYLMGLEYNSYSPLTIQNKHVQMSSKKIKVLKIATF